MITGKNYIGFELSAEGTKTYRTFNPKKNKENEQPETVVNKDSEALA